MSSINKKETLFDLYDSNWTAVKQHPKIRVEPNEEHVFVCPICFKAYPRDAIYTHDITLEHIPPKKLKGKARVMTCKTCNNTAGQDLDIDLIEEHRIRDFANYVPGVALDAAVLLDQHGKQTSIPVSFSMEVDGDGKRIFKLEGMPNRTDPAHSQLITAAFQSGTSQSFQIRFSSYRVRRPTIARLRIAYLWAFSVFGYGYIMNPFLNKVRYQLLHPGEDVIPNWDTLKADYPDEVLGLSMITSPKEIQSFLVVFDVVSTMGTTSRYGVPLPGFGPPGAHVYQHMAEQPSGTQERMTVTSLEDDLIQRDIQREPFFAANLWWSLITDNN